MVVYRIAKKQYARDLSGFGARSHGGRWNEKGIPVIYTSESRALATVELLVHLPLALVPGNLSLVSMKIPDSISPKKIFPSKLPRDWRAYPAPAVLASLGTEWILGGVSLLLRVPSAVVENEYNILINPQHRDIKRVSIHKVEPYTFDERLLK
jgi:RES domain-containing protein